MTATQLAALNQRLIALGIAPLNPPPRRLAAHEQEQRRCPPALQNARRRTAEQAARRGLLIRHYDATWEVR